MWNSAILKEWHAKIFSSCKYLININYNIVMLPFIFPEIITQFDKWIINNFTIFCNCIFKKSEGDLLKQILYTVQIDSQMPQWFLNGFPSATKTF